MTFLTLAGSGLGMPAVKSGMAVGPEIPLIVSCLVFSLSALITLLAIRSVPLQTIATASTVYLTIYLSAGSIIAITGSGQHLDLFIYLSSFVPLLVFNKLVNAPAVGRFFTSSLIAAPLLILCGFSFRLAAIFKAELLMVLAASSLSYLCYGLTLNLVTRYREEYVVERTRAESLKKEAEVFESISDCFISLDSSLRLVYLNDAACTKFGVERCAALHAYLPAAVPGFFSEPMLAGLQAASGKAFASTFEAQNEKLNLWYEMRCFPRPEGMSIYFRNITEAMVSRRNLDEAHGSLRDQAELLDKAQDAILVADMDGRLIYWNKGAERLYGWTAQEVKGRLAGDIFEDASDEVKKSVASVVKYGEWDGELSQHRRDGSALIVESRRTLVTAEDGKPRSILAINTDITNRKEAEAKIEHLAFYDALTELPNRLLLRERLDRALATALLRTSRGALLFIDLDDFKTLNDTLGHDVGDLLLQEVALRLTSCVRTSDTVARLGGDEFVVMLEGLSDDPKTSAAEANVIGDKILGAFLHPFHVQAYECMSTASVGITLFSGESGTAEDLLKRADLAMYRAKAQGRNRICFFDPAMETFVASRAALQSDLRRAVQNRSFELHYQPQVNSKGQVTGAEALLRWRHPRGGMVPPSEFIPLAEEAGLMIELGCWVLETACTRLAEWALRPGFERLSMAVNVSLRQFLDANFVHLVLEVLAASGANPHRLKLEITESSVMENANDTIAKMSALREQGVGFSLDDFGTGYSSLSRLRRLPLEQLKIDRSFVSDVLTNAKDASIARTIITLGRSLDLSVIAEGVETEGRREFLEAEGCHAYQGFLFSKALSACEFEAFVTAWPPQEETVTAA